MAKTLAELREQHQKMMASDDRQNTSSGDKKSEWASFEQGDNLVRFLPGKEDPLEFFVEGSVHKYQDGEGKWRNYKCRKTEGEKCPVCEYYFELWKRHKELNLGKGPDGRNIKSKFGDLAVKINAKPRYFAIGVVRALQEQGEDPVRYVAMSKQLFNPVFAAMVNPDFQDEDDADNSTIISLERGNDFNVRLTKNGDYTNFNESSAKYKKSRAGTPAEVAEWMDNQLDLKPLVEIDTYEKGVEIVRDLESELNPIRTETTPPFEPDGPTIEDIQV